MSPPPLIYPRRELRIDPRTYGTAGQGVINLAGRTRSTASETLTSFADFGSRVAGLRNGAGGLEREVGSVGAVNSRRLAWFDTN